MPDPRTPRPMTPADIRRQVVVEELDLAPDGETAVVVRRTIRSNRYLGHLLAIPLDAGRAIAAPRVMTTGVVRDTKPRISPDGQTIAFGRSFPKDDERPSRLMLMPLAGGTARALRRGDHGGIGEIAWSPDGRRIAFTSEVDPPRFIVGPTAKVGRTDKDSPRARHIRRTDWRWDEDGHLDRWAHLFVVDAVPGATPRQITSGDWGVADIAWHPDGRTVAFASDRGPEPDLVPRTTIWAVDVDARTKRSAEPREILAPGGWANHPAYSPDGRWVTASGVLETLPLDHISPTVMLTPADGSRAADPIDLAPDLDRAIGNWVDTDLNGWMVSGRHGPWFLDDRTILATVSDHARSHPRRFRFDPATGAPVDPPLPIPTSEIATWPAASTHTLAVAPATRAVVALATIDARAMEVESIDLDADGAAPPRYTTRSRIGAAWQRRFAPVVLRSTFAPGPGGPIETWIATLADAPDGPMPTIVDVHGGPLGAWAPAPHVEVILLASAGYRVVLPNIRGSATYGRAWIRPQLGDWGGVDAADVHAAVDHVIAEGLVDPERLGVMGLSYGGFMVNWLVGTTDRFKAAVSENGVTNQVSGYALSDSGPEYCRAALLGDPWTPDGVEKLWRQSPLRHVANARTPLLMLQGEADLRCPPQDNEQFFIALRHLRREVEYVLYPDESHVYASAGRPDRRIDRNERIQAWFDRHLRG